MEVRTMNEIRAKFNNYINNQAPKQLENLFDKLDENGIFDSSRNSYSHKLVSVKRILKYTHGQ